MQHYFCKVIDNIVYLEKDDVFHFTHVMRAKLGDELIAISDGKEFLAKVTCFSPLRIEVVSKLDSNSELPIPLTLFFALAKGDKIDLVIQKASELGVSKIVLVKSKRDVVKLTQEDFEKKLIRYKSIAKEASEQSRRQVIPEIVGLVDINAIPTTLLSEKNFVGYEKEAGNAVKFDIKEAKSVSILIGSEGGISEEEIVSLTKQGFVPVSLGKRILRTETAAIYSLSVLGYLLEK